MKLDMQKYRSRCCRVGAWRNAEGRAPLGQMLGQELVFL